VEFNLYASEEFDMSGESNFKSGRRTTVKCASLVHHSRVCFEYLACQLAYQTHPRGSKAVFQLSTSRGDFCQAEECPGCQVS